MTLPSLFASYACEETTPNVLRAVPNTRSMSFPSGQFTPFGASFPLADMYAAVFTSSLADLYPANNGVSVAMAVQLPASLGSGRYGLIGFADENNSYLTFGMVKNPDGSLHLQAELNGSGETVTGTLNLASLLGTQVPVAVAFNPSTQTVTGYVNGELALSTNFTGILDDAQGNYWVYLGCNAVNDLFLTGLQVGGLEIYNGAADLVDLKRQAVKLLKVAQKRNQAGPGEGDADAFDDAMPVRALLVRYNSTSGKIEPVGGGSGGTAGADEILLDIKDLLDQFFGLWGFDTVVTNLATLDSKIPNDLGVTLPAIVTASESQAAAIGAKDDAAAGSDTGTFSVLSFLKRMSGNITGIFGRLWAALGQTTSANSVPVVIANDQSALTITNSGIGSTTDAASGTDTANGSLISLTKKNNQNVTTVGTNIGATNEGVAGTDTATSGLNGLTKRGLQRITTLLSVLPASLGQKTMAAAFPVSIASDQTAVPTANRQVTITTKAPQRITSVASGGTTALTVPGGSTHCTIQAQGTRIYYRLDATAAATTDQYIEVGGYLSLQGAHLAAARFCSESGTGVLAVNYWQETP